MNNSPPPASLSFDLDNKWSYLKTRGEPAWESLPSYLDILIPRVLRFLKERSLRVTFFVVGQDAALPANRDLLRSLADEGHEIGNHSFHHEPWLHLYGEAEARREIETTEEHIERVTGVRPIGFRGPGYSISATVLKVLGERGYLYDASTFPAFTGPLARAYYFMAAGLSGDEKKRRALLFGTLRDGFGPLRLHRLPFGGRGLVEVPVTTVPVFRVPFHFSYLLYLSRFSARLALSYFSAALVLCRLRNVQPSLLLHPLDFLGPEDTSGLSFFPAMDLPAKRKLELLADALQLYGRKFEILPIREHVRRSADTLERQ